MRMSNAFALGKTASDAGSGGSKEAPFAGHTVEQLLVRTT